MGHTEGVQNKQPASLVQLNTANYFVNCDTDVHFVKHIV